MTGETGDLLRLDLPRAEEVRASLPERDEVDAMAAAAKALGDPTRLAVALALREGGQLCGLDLGWVVGVSQQLVSHHVRLLRTAGLARSERDGKLVLYELTPDGRTLVDTVRDRRAA
ncbi:metalloregulator ArsR/SmtB family transcription factor [Conexibacter sp. SYSU D00693]|uniref:ArsR/SmtB family transcription factor n=1 Tax=Conexibacter sp. SYSU D00693 TaxID=2812560 RepID=UPI00196B2F5A|nr:metalloregulator ArsR/SmtB family transcription factor [Conexibacter sp. SYSU D00693]